MKGVRQIGFHVSISGGIYRSIERGMELGINAFQIFLKNSNQWEAKPYTDQDIEKFKSLRKESGIKSIFAHAGYLINLCGSGDIIKKSINALADEIRRAASLDIEYIVIHPGSHMGAGMDEGIKKIADSIDRAYSLSGKDRIRLLLETTAGQGSSIGYKFEHLLKIIEICDNRDNLDVCLDTCHVFAAGYNLSEKKEYRKTLKEFDSILGMQRLKLIHLNDSKKELGTRVDRHEHIGEGFIGLKGFELLLKDPMIKSIPLILETPKIDESSDPVNLAKVRKLLK